ncbi:MAG: hypothetical protein Q4G26_11160, partial [Paracoccus sp. (in: a-proteobacteria)]|nr:hypothetical protein [Paracoccus sp. (in: a-proteobacteria)]
LLDQGIPGEVIRFVLLMTHYRKPMDWTEEKAREAMIELREWREQVDNFKENLARHIPDIATPSTEVIGAIADDLNTHAAITALRKQFASMMKTGASFARGETDGRTLMSEVVNFEASARMLGLLQPEMGAWIKDDPWADDIRQLAAQVCRRWQELRREKNWSAADKLKKDMELSHVRLVSLGGDMTEFKFLIPYSETKANEIREALRLAVSSYVDE